MKKWIATMVIIVAAVASFMPRCQMNHDVEVARYEELMSANDWLAAELALPDRQHGSALQAHQKRVSEAIDTIARNQPQEALLIIASWAKQGVLYNFNMGKALEISRALLRYHPQEPRYQQLAQFLSELQSRNGGSEHQAQQRFAEAVNGLLALQK